MTCFAMIIVAKGEFCLKLQFDEEGTCVCEEPPTSGRIVDVLCLRADMARRGKRGM